MGEPQQLELGEAAGLPVADGWARLVRRRGVFRAWRRVGVWPSWAERAALAWRQRAFGARPPVAELSVAVAALAAVVSAVVGDGTEALIIGGIMAMSVGLSFLNEFRSEKAVEALHSQIRHLAFVDRDGQPARSPSPRSFRATLCICVSATSYPPICACSRRTAGVRRVCADRRVTGRGQDGRCAPARRVIARSASCVFMGTLVRGGDGRGLVVRTGPTDRVRRDRARLGERQGQTAFQQGLQAFSRLLAIVTVVLAGSIFVINAALGRSILQSALVRARDRCRPDAAAAARDRHCQPGHRRAPAGTGAG